MAEWPWERPQQSGDLRLHAVAPDVFFYRGYFSNSAVFALKSSVLVVDTQVTPASARHMLEEIARATPKPIRFAVNTHYHGDHVGGNGAFADAEIVASRETARLMIERDSERLDYARTFGLEIQEVPRVPPPTQLFEERLNLEVDGDRVEIFRCGRVETSDACVVWWPSRRALAAGDGVTTFGYPFFGVPFLDEGLRDDGEWLRHLDALLALRPEILLPGHGPALLGAKKIAARLELLKELIQQLLEAVREEMESKTPLPDLIRKVDARLSRFGRRRDLRQNVATQRFAIYRAFNSLSPERRGKGWWSDLRPSIVERAPRELAAPHLLGGEGAARLDALRLAREGKRPVAIAIMEQIAERSNGADAFALLSEIHLGGVRSVGSVIDASEYVGAAAGAAKSALARDPAHPLALLNLGTIEIFSAMIVGQDPSRGLDRVNRALESDALTEDQRRRATFMAGKAHQFSFREAAADECFRALLPSWARPLFPLVRARIRALP